MSRLLAALVGLTLALTISVGRPLTAPLSDEVWLDRLTWVEVRELIRHGKTVAILPTGGTEQNGPHMVLGKHNYIVSYTAEQIARELGNALVAPVVAYVPEGTVDPARGHMRFAGTLSVPDEVFAAVLEHAARSLRAHGFTTICLVGDSGDSQAAQEMVASKLTTEWAGTGIRVLHIGDYYGANGQTDWLLEQGETKASIGSHAGIRDTAELMAVFPEGVRQGRRARDGGAYRENTGVRGDPTQATAERGRHLLRLKIDAAVRQIHADLRRAQL